MPVPLLPAYQHMSRCDAAEEAAWRLEPLDTGPAYVRSRDATRWHRPRSGYQHPRGYTGYHYWCGASASHGLLGVEEIGPDEPLCATCEGRFLAQGPGSWRFDPIAHRAPGQCPASRTEYWVPRDYRHGTFPCLVCGESVKGHAISRWYSGVAVTRHAPGPGLVPPCRYHGWFHLVLREGRVVCRCLVPVVPERDTGNDNG